MSDLADRYRREPTDIAAATDRPAAEDAIAGVAAPGAGENGPESGR